MNRIGSTKNLWRIVLGLGTTGTLFAASCSSAQIDAVLLGLQVAAETLQAEEDDDISFGDWVRDELEDL